MSHGLQMKQSFNLFKQQQNPNCFPLPSSKPPVHGKVARTRSDTLLLPALSPGPCPSSALRAGVVGGSPLRGAPPFQRFHFTAIRYLLEGQQRENFSSQAKVPTERPVCQAGASPLVSRTERFMGTATCCCSVALLTEGLGRTFLVTPSVQGQLCCV